MPGRQASEGVGTDQQDQRPFAAADRCRTQALERRHVRRLDGQDAPVGCFCLLGVVADDPKATLAAWIAELRDDFGAWNAERKAAALKAEEERRRRAAAAAELRRKQQEIVGAELAPAAQPAQKPFEHFRQRPEDKFLGGKARQISDKVRDQRRKVQLAGFDEFGHGVRPGVEGINQRVANIVAMTNDLGADCILLIVAALAAIALAGA